MSLYTGERSFERMERDKQIDADIEAARRNGMMSKRKIWIGVVIAFLVAIAAFFIPRFT